MAKVTCPNCRKLLPMPDALVGRKVRCSACNTVFLTAPAKAPAAAGASISRTAGTSASRAADAGVITVKARRVGVSGVSTTSRTATLSQSRAAAAPSTPVKSRGRGAWFAVAAAALLLPALAAGGFVAFKVLGARGQHREVYGGIEIGSSGIKATVVELFPDEALGYDYRFLEKNKSFDTQLVADMKKTGRFAPVALQDSLKAVKQFYGEMTKDYNVPPERIFIVGSSSLFDLVQDGDGETKEERIQKAKASLAGPVEEATGKKMDFNTVDGEVEQLITALVPKKYEDESLLIDVGTGGTRGGYRDSSGVFVTFKAPGVKGFEEQIKRQADNKPAQLPGAADQLAKKELHDKLIDELKKKENYPGLMNRKRVYLNGGTIWVMATLSHPEARDAQVHLTAADIDDFRDRVRRTPELNFPEFQIPPGLDAEAKKDVEGNVDRMKEKFKTPKLIAGAEVLKTLSDEMAFSGRDLYYTRDGDVGWLLSYIGEAYTREKNTAKK